jgi:hypothetical protein
MAIFLSVAIFAAAQVHFTFVALLATLVFGALLSPIRLRRFIVIGVVIVAAIVAGSMSRASLARESVRHFKEALISRGVITSIQGPGALARIPAPAQSAIHFAESQRATSQ